MQAGSVLHLLTKRSLFNCLKSPSSSKKKKLGEANDSGVKHESITGRLKDHFRFRLNVGSKTVADVAMWL